MAPLAACLFFEILVHVLNIASAKARAKTVFGHLNYGVLDRSLSLCLRCLSGAAKITLRLSDSSEPLLLRISAKKRERQSSNSLPSYLTMSSLRPFILPTISKRLSSFNCNFVYCFLGKLLYFFTGNYGNLAVIFLKTKAKASLCSVLSW